MIRNASRLADRFRSLGAVVVLVRVAFEPDSKDALNPPCDAPVQFNRPPNWSEIVPELGPKAGDLVITKRQWGAFYGTDLDLQLRRRGIRTIVLGGIATNMGVESTARGAFEHGYAQVFAEDAMTSMSAEMHEFAVKNIFPGIGNVRSAEQAVGPRAVIQGQHSR